MVDSRNHDGAGAALIAVVLIVLLVFAVSLYFGVMSFSATRRVLAAREQVALEQAESAKAAQRAVEGQADRDQEFADDATASSGAIADGEVRQVLQQQLDAWNAGDIEGFMQHYWKSDDVTFSSGGAMTRGWDATLEGYKQHYPSPEEMGQTTFDNLHISLLAPGAALVLGDWQLTRELDVIGGSFSLVLRRIDGRWVIVHDHTSRSPTP